VSGEDVNRIFDRFYRLNVSRDRAEGGSGLGLAIAKSIVQAHGGQIWAESVPGQGLTVFIELPISSRSRTNAGTM
jgi:two-component system sensor histidine kinase VicK